MMSKLEQIQEALEINTRKTKFIVRDYPDDKEAKLGVELGEQALKLLDEHREEMEATNENYSKVEKRMADLLCYAMKYETKENADVIEGVARRYLMSFLKAMANNTLGTDCLPQPPKGE